MPGETFPRTIAIRCHAVCFDFRCHPERGRFVADAFSAPRLILRDEGPAVSSCSESPMQIPRTASRAPESWGTSKARGTPLGMTASRSGPRDRMQQAGPVLACVRHGHHPHAGRSGFSDGTTSPSTIAGHGVPCPYKNKSRHRVGYVAGMKKAGAGCARRKSIMKLHHRFSRNAQNLLALDRD